ncbi:unnamed protein product [Cylicocyclus nassatus]|uniref:Uncharacterized protein n=1 Tax=Cylicocyclus nassatus TaxID=53992 RepID=A0AA36DN24_CYLNA|nr:unnamed protein product [Cylicocyclus nassatus]
MGLSLHSQWRFAVSNTKSLCSQRKEFNLMLDEFLERVGYDREKHEDPHPLGWPRPAGIGATTLAIQAKMTHTFWRYFCTEGKNKLNDYNNAH